MIDKSVVIGEIIAMLSAQFPSFEYVSLVDQGTEERGMARTDFGVVVRGVTSDDTVPILSYVHESIYLPWAQADRDLPTIITLAERRVQRPNTYEAA